MTYQRIVLLVLDSLGVGALPDAASFGDAGADTVGHVAGACGLEIPNLAGLGLGRISNAPGEFIAGAYGRNREIAAGKDTIAGHWEMTGVIVDRPFEVFPDGFPDDLVDAFTSIAGGRVPLCNEVASGTEVIARLGEEHMRTGRPILYTSADSVFQVAAHEDVIPLETLYAWCEQARELLSTQHRVGRVIARPFIGSPGAFLRTANRHDYAVDPEAPTVLDALVKAGLEVHGVGKIRDIYNGCGITSSVRSSDDMQGVDHTIAALSSVDRGLIFTNLVQLDQDFGHRRDAVGYRDQLQTIDARIPELLGALRTDDLLIITGDHGTDPTFPGTDHTREYTPLLVYTPGITDLPLGERATAADIAATIADCFTLPPPERGESFLASLH